MLWLQKSFLVSVAVSLLWLTVSVFINFYAGTYATENASNPVTDVILSNTPVLNVDELFVYGAVALIALIVLLVLTKPSKIPFTVNGISLLVTIRSAFITFTHIGPFPDQAPLDLGAITGKFIFGGDLFFSNHTAIPFFMALVFWNDKVLRYVFVALSIFFGTTALLGHLHYTIDVLSAFFITYSIYHLAIWMFPKSYALSERKK